MKFLPFLLLPALAGPLRAAPFTAEEAVAYALRHNPGLAAARLVLDEARGRQLAAGRLPDPELAAEYLPSTAGSEYVTGLAFTQRFPLTARLRHARALSAAGLSAAAAEVRAAERRLARDVRLRAIEWLALDAHRRLADKQAANARQLAAAVRAAAQAGEAAALEAAQLDLEAETLASPQLHHELARATLAGELRALLGLAPGETFELAGELPPPEPPAAAPPAGESPAVTAALARAAAAEHAVALARAERWDDVGVGLLYEHERQHDRPYGLTDADRVGLRVSVPLPLWRRNEGRRLETQAAAERARLEASAERARLAHEQATARAEMAAALRLYENLSATLLPRAMQLEEELGRARTAGLAALADVFRARDQRLELESERIEALREFHLARVRFADAAGFPP